MTKEESKKELKQYNYNIIEIQTMQNEIERYKNIKIGLKCTQNDGLPKGSCKENYNLEEAIIKIDEDINKLNDIVDSKLNECRYITNKINKLPVPYNIVLSLKYKEGLKNWEISEKLKKNMRQIDRYLCEAIEKYSEIKVDKLSSLLVD